jgi:hypothetical protein
MKYKVTLSAMLRFDCGYCHRIPDIVALLASEIKGIALCSIELIISPSTLRVTKYLSSNIDVLYLFIGRRRLWV